MDPQCSKSDSLYILGATKGRSDTAKAKRWGEAMTDEWICAGMKATIWWRKSATMRGWSDSRLYLYWSGTVGRAKLKRDDEEPKWQLGGPTLKMTIPMELQRSCKGQLKWQPGGPIKTARFGICVTMQRWVQRVTKSAQPRVGGWCDGDVTYGKWASHCGATHLQSER